MLTDWHTAAYSSPTQTSPYCIDVLQESFQRLDHQLEVAQRVSPGALRAVVGTKADLDNRQVQTEEALVGMVCVCVCGGGG